MSATTGFDLSPAQRQAVEWGDGPLMVLAGAGTGKTTVVVERVKHLLASDPDLAPENMLVLTYNVRAAGELVERFEDALGIEAASRLWVHNFHSFGYRLLREHRAEARVSRDGDLLDGVGQRLLLRDLQPQMRDLLYYDLTWNAMDTFGDFAEFISRAKDELVTPAEYAAYAASRRAAFERGHGPGSWAAAIEDLRTVRSEAELDVIRDVRGDLLRHGEEQAAKTADREARRRADGTGKATAWGRLSPEQAELARALKPTYTRDAEALEVLRLEEESLVYRLYQEELTRRGQLDFGEQMARAIGLLLERPNLALRYQGQFRHVLVDEFQDANMAQIQLLELVGRGPDKPDNVVVVGDDDQSIYRFRGASYAAFERFQERFGSAPTFDPARPAVAVASVPLIENRRSAAHIIAAANRVIEHNSARLKVETPLTPTRAEGAQVEVVIATDAQDEAEAIVERIRGAYEALPEPRRWRDIAVLYRRHAHRLEIIDRLARANIPYSVIGATGLFVQPEVRDLEAALRVLADPADSVSFTRLLTAGPWRFDAGEIMELRRRAEWDRRAMLQAARELLEQMHAVPSEAQPAEVGGSEAEVGPPEPFDAALRAKLERLFGVIEDLVPRAWRDGPASLTEEFVVRTSLVHDLVASGTPEAHQRVLNIARFMRFAADYQAAHRRHSLRDFIDYVDLFEEAGGDLEDRDRRRDRR